MAWSSGVGWGGSTSFDHYQQAAFIAYVEGRHRLRRPLLCTSILRIYSLDNHIVTIARASFLNSTVKYFLETDCICNAVLILRCLSKPTHHHLGLLLS